MTTKILEALRENKEKFDKVSEITKEIKQAKEDRNKIIPEIIELYKILFKNFDTSRKETTVKIRGQYGDLREICIIFLTNDGIAIKEGSYGKNTRHIDVEGIEGFIKIIKQIKEKENELILFIRENKKEIFTKFMEKVYLLENIKENRKKLEPALYINVDESEEALKMVSVEINGECLRFDYSGKWEWNKETYVSLNRLDLRDKFIIEQVYDELMSWLREYLEIIKANFENSKCFLEDLKTKFARELIINSLNKKSTKSK